MFKTLTVFAILGLAVLFSGCAEQQYDDSRFLADPAEVEVIARSGYVVPGAAEVDFVEAMAASRIEYTKRLQDLLEHYTVTGDATKQRWAQRELDLLMGLTKYRYLMPGQIADANLTASVEIPQADELYAEAQKLFKDAGGLIVLTDHDKYRQALSKFNLVISAYPASDKIDDAAYYAGLIYEYFGDSQIAAVYFQRTFQWDNATPYPARFKAAYTMDRKLHMRQEALALYQLSYQYESQYTSYNEYAQQRILSMTKPVKKVEDVVEELEDEVEEAPVEEQM